MQDKRNFQGGLNRDDDSRILPNGDYYYAQNIRVLSSEDRSAMLLENVRGMVKENFSQKVLGAKELEYKVIGSYEDKPTNCIYYFVWNNRYYHLILEYNINTDTVSTVYRDSGVKDESVLRFDTQTLITGINKIDDLLYWTCDNSFISDTGEEIHNEPKYINVKKAKAGWVIYYDGGDFSTNPTTDYDIETVYPFEFYSSSSDGTNFMVASHLKRRYIDVCKSRPLAPIYLYQTPIKNITNAQIDLGSLGVVGPPDESGDTVGITGTVAAGAVTFENIGSESIEAVSQIDFAYKKNNLYGFMWQFSYRYVYKNNETSAYSDFSYVLPSPQYGTNKVDGEKQNSYNQIRVWYHNGPADVEKIEIVARKCSFIETSPDNGNKGEFYLIATLDNNYYDSTYSSSSSTYQPLDSTYYGYSTVSTENVPYISFMSSTGNTITNPGASYGYFDFRNDGVYTQVDPIAFDKLFDQVPKRAKSQEIVNENRIVYGNYVDGYDQVKPHYHLSPIYGKSTVDQAIPSNQLSTVELGGWGGDPSNPQQEGLFPFFGSGYWGTNSDYLSGDSSTGMHIDDYTPYNYSSSDGELEDDAYKGFGWDANLHRLTTKIIFPTQVQSGQVFRVKFQRRVRYKGSFGTGQNKTKVDYPLNQNNNATSTGNQAIKDFQDFGVQIDLAKQVTGGGVSGMIDSFISDIKTMANFQQSTSGAGLTDNRGDATTNPDFGTGKIYTTWMKDSSGNQTYDFDGNQNPGAAPMRLVSIKKLDSSNTESGYPGTQNILEIQFAPYGQSIGDSNNGNPENGCEDKVNKHTYYFPDGEETTNLHLWAKENTTNDFRDSTEGGCSSFNNVTCCQTVGAYDGSQRYSGKANDPGSFSWDGEKGIVDLSGPTWSETTGVNEPTETLLKNTKNASSFKTGAWHRFGLVYGDSKGRTSTVMLNTEDISDTTYDRNSSVYVGFPTEKVFEQGPESTFSATNPSGVTTTALANGDKLAPSNMYWKIFHKPPIWARYYHWVYARNTSIGKFMQYTVDNAYVNKGAKAGTSQAEGINDTKLYISLNVMNGRLWSYSERNKSLIGEWSFAEGDRIRLIADANGTTFPQYYDFKIGDVGHYPGRFDIDPTAGGTASPEGISGNVTLINESPVGGTANAPETAKLGKYIIIDDPKISGYGVDQATNDNGDVPNWHKVTVEIYRPKKNTNEEQTLYHEFSERYEIGNKGLDNRYHGGAISDQGQTYDSNDKTLTAPAQGVFRRGDIWYKPRNLKSVDSGGSSISLGEMFYESYFLNDFLQTNHNNIGRPHVYSTYAKEQRRKATLTYSDVYQPDTQYNGLHSFNFSQRPYMDYDLSLGSIQKLVARDTNLVMMQENKISTILVSKDVIMSPSGDEGLTLSSNVLPEQAKPMSGDFGVCLNPESVAVHSSTIYFVDIKRGSVCRIGGDGITVVSDYKMTDFFRDKMDEYQSILTSEYEDKLGGGLFILGGYDPRHGEYVVTFPGIYSVEVSTTNAQIRPFVAQNGTAFNSETSQFQSLVAVKGVQSNLREDLNDISQEINGRVFTTKPVTIAFNEKANRWSSFYTYYPEYYGVLNRTFISFKDGQLYKHDSDPNSHCMFYENPYPEEAKVSFPFNTDVSGVKTFNSLSIEGDGKTHSIPILSTSATNEPATITATTGSANLEGANVNFNTNDIEIGDALWYYDDGTLRTLGVISAITDADTIVTSITEVNAFITASSTSSGDALNNVFVITAEKTAYRVDMETNINSSSLTHRLSYNNDLAANNNPGTWVEREDVIYSDISGGETNSAGGEYFGLGMSSFDSGSSNLRGVSVFSDTGSGTGTQYITAGVNVGDSIYWSDGGTETLIGVISSISNNASITLVGNATSSQNNQFVYVKKNSTIEGDSLKGHYMDTTLTKRTTEKVHIYAANANAINSELSNK